MHKYGVNESERLASLTLYQDHAPCAVAREYIRPSARGARCHLVVQPSRLAQHLKSRLIRLSEGMLLIISQTEFPESYGPRIMHQCNVAASDHPSG